MTTIDFNADLAEGSPHDAELLELVASANIACGAHAGSEPDIRTTLESVARLRRSFGYHPGYRDREYFGRREIDVDPEALRADLLTQCETVALIACRMGLAPGWIKPHGALYNRACRDAHTAGIVVGVALELGLPVMGLPDCVLSRMCGAAGLVYIPEGFADRRYRPDGTLVPRSEPDATIDDPAEAAEQVLRLWASGRVRTICVHGDRPESLEFLRAVRRILATNGSIPEV